MCSIRWFSTAETHELLIDFDFFLRGLRNMRCNISTVNRFMRFLVSLDGFEAGCLPNGGSFNLLSLRDIVLPAAVWRYVEDGCNPYPEQRTTGGEWKRLARCLAVLWPWCARVSWPILFSKSTVLGGIGSMLFWFFLGPLYELAEFPFEQLEWLEIDIIAFRIFQVYRV